VRLLTIHGAKGLEAPVVILADAAHDPRPDDSGHVLAALPGLPGEFPIYYPGGTTLPPDLAQLRDARRIRDAQEDMRLLYVALTRAADHLFVAGAVPASMAGSLGADDTRWQAARLKRSSCRASPAPPAASVSAAGPSPTAP
jgi:ATP-dependent helicase/nuclease subunit A